MKTCFKCGGPPQPLTNFYAHPQTADGRLGKCKECTKKDVTKNKPNPKTQRRKKGTMKITKEKARENRLDVLEGRAYVAELIEKRIPSSTWTKLEINGRSTASGSYVAKIGKLRVQINRAETADIFRDTFFSDKFLLNVDLAEGSYEKAASKAGYLKEVVAVLFALERQ